MGYRIWGFRIWKTTAAVVAAMYLAQALGLDSPHSAGLLAMLGIDVTKKKGIRTSFQRIAASMLGLLIAFALFWACGFQYWTVGLFVLLFMPLLVKWQLKEGAVTGSVTMFHVFAAGKLEAGLLLNEITLLVVGLGTATLINIVYMPKEDERLMRYKQRLEHDFSRIFNEIAMHLRDNEHIWNGQELLDAEDALNGALAAADRARANSLRGGDEGWTAYFYMRKQQLDSIDRMVRLVARVYRTLPPGELLASIFDNLSEDVKADYYTGRSEQGLHELEEQFRSMDLPSTREEFEVRAALLQLVLELKSYLAVAKREKKRIAAAKAHS